MKSNDNPSFFNQNAIAFGIPGAKDSSQIYAQSITPKHIQNHIILQRSETNILLILKSFLQGILQDFILIILQKISLGQNKLSSNVYRFFCTFCHILYLHYIPSYFFCSERLYPEGVFVSSFITILSEQPINSLKDS